MSENNQYSILIVDDIAENIKVLANILSSSNYNVRKALSGKVALRSINSNPPDLILLDIKMPEVDGYQVCEAIKNDPFTQDIPIIFISALNEVFDKVKAFQAGGADYVTKPFQIEEVIARIENQLTIQKQKKLLEKEIVKRQEAEEILYQSRALLASILNTSLDGVAALQAVRKPLSTEIDDFRCLVVNPVFAKMINTHEKNLTGKLVGKKLINKINSSLFDKLKKLVENGGFLSEDIYLKTGDKSTWYHFIANKLGDGFSLIIRDITKRKQMELQLKFLANSDGLTRIANRRLFDTTMKSEWNRHLRQEHSLSLIMADVDYFKAYNDAYGHLQGDECLRQIARCLHATVKRAGELVARFGGEEFIIILPQTSVQNAIALGQSIQKNISQLNLNHEYSEVSDRVTLSIGIASTIPTKNQCLSNLMELVDQALYGAKKKGRNCIIARELK
ncbi:MAG: diguanylate cyclase domain-containing protein [Cyanobacterium sp.]